MVFGLCMKTFIIANVSNIYFGCMFNGMVFLEYVVSGDELMKVFFNILSHLYTTFISQPDTMQWFRFFYVTEPRFFMSHDNDPYNVAVINKQKKSNWYTPAVLACSCLNQFRQRAPKSGSFRDNAEFDRDTFGSEDVHAATGDSVSDAD